MYHSKYRMNQRKNVNYKPNHTTMQTIQQIIDSTPVRTFATERPEYLLIQPSARHELKNDGLNREAELIAQASTRGFVLAAFDTCQWARALMPWHDDAVSVDCEVGLHARHTLCFVLHRLLPWLEHSYGRMPCIVGGYSLGAMWALWAACQTGKFGAVAAASPSLWIDRWSIYAQANPIMAQSVYLSLGDREEHCRNQRMRLIGDGVRRQHLLMQTQLGNHRTTLEWNHGGHFGDEPQRTARAFAWCMDNLQQG